MSGLGPLASACAALMLSPVTVFAEDDAAPQFSHRLGGNWSFGGSLELESIAERRFNLDSGDEDVVTLEPQLDLGLAYEPAIGPRFYGEFRFSHGAFLEGAESDRDSRTKAELRQAYLEFELPKPGYSLQLGRQRFEDEREWWYDEDLDAIRLLYATGRFEYEISASRNELVGGDLLNRERARRGDNFMAVARYALGESADAEAYLIAQDRGTEPDEEPIFVGLRSIGGIGSGIDYWIDAALVRGNDAGRDIRAYGFDVGAEWHLDLPLEPAIHFGIAFGSGDADPDDRIDHEFRQTGLQNSFFYYGEVLAPELSNLWIYTAGLSVEPGSKTSLQFLYHRYRQDHASATLRDALIETEPDGLHRRIGEALDLAVSQEIAENAYLDLVLGVFAPGPAFGPNASHAVFGQAAFTYEFW